MSCIFLLKIFIRQNNNNESVKKCKLFCEHFFLCVCVCKIEDGFHYLGWFREMDFTETHCYMLLPTFKKLHTLTHSRNKPCLGDRPKKKKVCTVGAHQSAHAHTYISLG